jgi:DNA-binding SARP family transcriptional activator
MLGALEVRVGDQRVVVGSPRQRTVLAMFLLSADRVVSIDSMVEAVWNGNPPATGRTQIAICVAALRKAFKAAGCTDDVIVTMPPGYLLRSAGHRIDAVDFAAHVSAAHVAARQGRGAEAADLLGAALDLWHGPALAGVTGYLVEAEATRLEEQRLTAYEMRTALRLELDQHGSLISELAAMVREYPLREQVRAQLMLAQYRAGRRAEALETFRAGRQHFIEEIGIEPGPALRELHDAILRDDPSLTLSPTLGVQFGGALVPAQLPPDLPGFIGREPELAVLDGLSASDTDHAPAAGVVIGPAGVGKTGLALHWAHRVAERFPDGQLFADLHGYDEGTEPTDPSTVLGSFLRALGVPDERISADPQERATLYRSILDGRRVLVILDNVRTVEQILPLLPGNGRCCVLITGRSALGELLGGHGVIRVRLGVMAEREAKALLDVVVGDGRLASDPESTARLGELCGRLPLALRISATRLAAKPHWSVRHLVARLEDHRRRLDELDADRNHLRGSFEPSYRHLGADAATMYRRLGILDTPNFTAWVGAALLDVDLTEAEGLLEQLVDAQLLDVGSDQHTVRYRFQELLRLHAREHALREDTNSQRQAANERVLGGWLDLAVEAHRREFGGTRPILHGVSPLWHCDRDYVDELLCEPRQWLERERTSILDAIGQASRLRLVKLARGLTIAARTLFAGDDRAGELLAL